MRYLEVRRHSFTKKGEERGRGSHLSQEGVSAARAVGAELGPVPYVASESPRTLETAVAMAFAVDDTLPLGWGYSTSKVAHHEQWTWEMPYVTTAICCGREGSSQTAHELSSNFGCEHFAASPRARSR